MVDFLSGDWVDALDRAARASTHLARHGDASTIVLEQRVTLPDGAEHAHHLVLAPGGARVERGRAAAPTVVLVTDLPTAAALAHGTLNAQAALARGRLRVRGDVDALARLGEMLASLGDVFAAVRAETTFVGPVDGPVDARG